jgi:hypothetical protein
VVQYQVIWPDLARSGSLWWQPVPDGTDVPIFVTFPKYKNSILKLTTRRVVQLNIFTVRNKSCCWTSSRGATTNGQYSTVAGIAFEAWPAQPVPVPHAVQYASTRTIWVPAARRMPDCRLYYNLLINPLRAQAVVRGGTHRGGCWHKFTHIHSILVCLGDFGQILGPSSVLFGGCCCCCGFVSLLFSAHLN